MPCSSVILVLNRLKAPVLDHFRKDIVDLVLELVSPRAIAMPYCSFVSMVIEISIS